MAEILIGEDDADVRKWLGIALESEGYAVRTAADGEATLAATRENRPDLLILDVMMPKLSGLDVCKTIRADDPKLPIMMLTARNKESDILKGFGCGADDYVTKPFSMNVLFARVAALLRRTQNPATRLAIGSHMVDSNRMTITDGKGREEQLTAREFDLLTLLAENHGDVLKRDDILNRLWGITFYGNTRTLDQHIATLRRKLGSDQDMIETVRNVGYRLRSARCVPHEHPLIQVHLAIDLKSQTR